jgi:hypothetical protein
MLAHGSVGADVVGSLGQPGHDHRVGPGSGAGGARGGAADATVDEPAIRLWTLREADTRWIRPAARRMLWLTVA